MNMILHTGNFERQMTDAILKSNMVFNYPLKLYSRKQNNRLFDFVKVAAFTFTYILPVLI